MEGDAREMWRDVMRECWRDVMGVLDKVYNAGPIYNIQYGVCTAHVCFLE